MKNLIILLLITFSLAKGETFLGLRYGVNFSTISPSNNRLKTGNLIGFQFEKIAKKNVIFGVEFQYSELGYKDSMNVLYNDHGIGIGIRPAENIYHYNYYSFPLKIGYKTGKKNFFYSNICISPSRFIIDTYSQFDSFYITNYPGNGSGLSWRLNQKEYFNLMLNLETGFSIKITKWLHFYTSLSYIYSLNKFPFSNRGLSTSMGFKCLVIK
jgi:hypothetical protein